MSPYLVKIERFLGYPTTAKSLKFNVLGYPTTAKSLKFNVLGYPNYAFG